MWGFWKKDRMSKKQPVASLSKFKKIFLNSFNLGFGYWSTDVCSRCVFLKNKIFANIDSERNEIELKVHHRRVDKFFEILKLAL